VATDVAKLTGLGERFRHSENRAVMPEDPTTSFIVPVFSERKFFDERTVRTVLQLPARFAYRFDAVPPSDLVRPILYRTVHSLRH
jgi:hypothetical protein